MLKGKKINSAPEETLITIVLFTYNRINFLLRALDYYSKVFKSDILNVVITDASSENKFKEFKNIINEKNYNLNITLLNHPEDINQVKIFEDAYGEVKYSYVGRFSDTLKVVKTPYVILAADDDFYFSDYIIKGINFLEKNKDYGTVYGHILEFELNNFLAHGKIIKTRMSPENNPPNPWMEDETIEERLNSLGKSEWSWFGWYAIQRTELLELILSDAKKYHIDGQLFEKFMSFYQATLYKSKKLDLIYSARQTNSISYSREPLSYKRNKKEIENFIIACSLLLKSKKNYEESVARFMVEKTFLKDIEHFKSADRKRFLRHIKNKFSFIRQLFSYLIPRKYYIQDKRLPIIPDIKTAENKIQLIKKIVDIDNNHC